MKKSLVLFGGATLALALFTGCAGIKPLPAEYYARDHEMSVEIPRIPEKAVMRDSGQGGLIGLMVNAGRSSNLRQKMAGIQGATVKELLRQEISRQIGGTFIVSEANKDLLLEVKVMTWGWFVPSTVLGIKTGAYQCELIGGITIYDMSKNKKKVAFTTLTAQEPLGNNPEEASAKESLVKVVQVFSEQVGKFVMQQKSAQTASK